MSNHFEFTTPWETDAGEVILTISFSYIHGRKATRLDPPEDAEVNDIEISPEGIIDENDRKAIENIREQCFEHVYNYYDE